MRLRLRVVGVALAGLDRAALGQPLEVADDSTLANLLAILQPPDPAHLALFVNGIQVHAEAAAATQLTEGDELVLVRPIEGG